MAQGEGGVFMAAKGRGVVAAETAVTERAVGMKEAGRVAEERECRGRW